MEQSSSATVATDHANQSNALDTSPRRESVASQASQTAKEFIESQLRLEADAREILPYSFDSCTYALGPLRQSLFACITCNPPPTHPDAPYTAAAVCYSCSIACHGEHTLVELFNKRNFVCDCGTTRLPPSAPCTLRNDPKTGRKGVHSEEPAPGNKYSHNFQNRFCGCGGIYDAYSEKGTMYQCLGLGSVETGGCGEDWWHPECLIGAPRDWNQPKKDVPGKEGSGAVQIQATDTAPPTDGYNGNEEEDPVPPGFPKEEDFETFLCYKCVESNPWLKRYAGTPGFLPAVFKDGGMRPAADQESHRIKPEESAGSTPSEQAQPKTNSAKRKLDDDEAAGEEPSFKRNKPEDATQEPAPTTFPSTNNLPTGQSPPKPKHELLPVIPPSSEPFSLFLKEDFRDHFCRCPECYPHLARHPQLREEEETYEPPLSEDGGDTPNGGGGARSHGTGSLLDRGEAALSNIDRVRAIEGAMVYNHLVGNVKEFLKPYAESGTPVSAEDIKAFFEKLRGDDRGIKEAAAAAGGGDDNGDGQKKDGSDGGGHGEGDSRREQSGY